MSTLIADCGSTKALWAIIPSGYRASSPDTPTPAPIPSPASSPTLSPAPSPAIIPTTGFNAAISSAEEIKSILATELAPSIGNEVIDHIFFYGAGCIGGETDRRLAALLSEIFPSAEIEVASDLLGAARALFGHSSGIACILGTGSNCGIYDGRQITSNTPPMGYILGDEGSGAVLGRNLINHIFKHPGLLPTGIIEDFHLTYRLSKGDIIERVYRRPAANRFLASFCPFLKKHLSHPTIRAIVTESFTGFLKANLPQCSATAVGEENIPHLTVENTPHLPEKDFPHLPIGFIGSIAYHFSPILTQVCQASAYKAPLILQSPLDGLISYHAD